MRWSNLMVLEQLQDTMIKNTNSLRAKKYRKSANPLRGLCYVASEAVYHIFPRRFVPYRMKVKNESHWFLKERSGRILDLTAGQYSFDLNYAKAKRVAFLTKKPSKRTQLLIDKLNGRA